MFFLVLIAFCIYLYISFVRLSEFEIIEWGLVYLVGMTKCAYFVEFAYFRPANDPLLLAMTAKEWVCWLKISTDRLFEVFIASQHLTRLYWYPKNNVWRGWCFGRCPLGQRSRSHQTDVSCNYQSHQIPISRNSRFGPQMLWVRDKWPCSWAYPTIVRQVLLQARRNSDYLQDGYESKRQGTRSRGIKTHTGKLQ